MAEFLLKVDDGAGFEDGDIINAFNDRRIKCVHAEWICHPKHAPRNSGGLIVVDSLCWLFCGHSYQYLFERVSPEEVMRTQISTGQQDLFSNTPTDNGEAIDVRAFVALRRRHPRCIMFGEDGAEKWFGGVRDFSLSVVVKAWKDIENKSDLKEKDHERWPMGKMDVKSHLPIAVDDFDDVEMGDLESPLGTPDNIIKVRKHGVKWKDDLELNPGDINRVKDKRATFDLRERKKFLKSIIKAKG